MKLSPERQETVWFWVVVLGLIAILAAQLIGWIDLDAVPYWG